MNWAIWKTLSWRRLVRVSQPLSQKWPNSGPNWPLGPLTLKAHFGPLFSISIKSNLKCPGINSGTRLKFGCSIMILSKHLISKHSIAVKSCGNQTIPHTVKTNARFAKHGNLLVEPARSMGGLNIRTMLRRKLDVMRTQDSSMMKRKSQRNKQWRMQY